MDMLLVIWAGIVPGSIVILLFVNVAVNNMVNNHARANGKVPTFSATRKTRPRGVQR